MPTLTRRSVALKRLLLEQRRTIQKDMDARARDGRAGSAHVGDDLEHSEADIQTDLTLALLQMGTHRLARIDEALGRIDAGTYGACFECGDDISPSRLKALPFAARCQACQERREQDQGNAQRAARRYAGVSLFSDLTP